MTATTKTRTAAAVDLATSASVKAQTSAHGAVGSSSPLGIFTSASAFELLFTRARPNLTRDELQHLACEAPAYVQTVARRAAEVAQGLGCLVAGDGGSDGSPNAGSFQSKHDVPSVLWHFAEVLQLVEGLSSVAADAASELLNFSNTEGAAP